MTVRLSSRSEAGGVVSAYVPGLPVYAAADSHIQAERAIRAGSLPQRAREPPLAGENSRGVRHGLLLLAAHSPSLPHRQADTARAGRAGAGARHAPSGAVHS